jgi:5-formyltetrahydrofolate cyclo-ligase
MGARRRSLAAREAERAGRAVAERLAETPEFAACRRLALYAPRAGELPTGPLAESALARGLALLWPRVSGGALEFVACRADELAPGAFGVAEPPAGCAAVALGGGDLAVLPALALDGAGRRLGRGGGHYDRALAEPAHAGTFWVGVGYDFQWMDEVPAGEGDARVDMVVTEARLVRTRARGGAR